LNNYHNSSKETDEENKDQEKDSNEDEKVKEKVKENHKKLGLLLPKDKLLTQSKNNLISNEIKNSKLIQEIGKLLCLNLNRDNFDIKETNSDNIFIITEISDNDIIRNKNNNNNYNNNKEQNLLNEINQLKIELEKYKKEN